MFLFVFVLLRVFLLGCLSCFPVWLCFAVPVLIVCLVPCWCFVVQLVPVIFSQKTDSLILPIVVGAVYGFIALIIQGIFTAVLLKSRVEEDEKKRTKTVKKLSVLAILSTAVYTLFIISASMVMVTSLVMMNMR
mgnify:CR=1 FL=1